MAKKRSSNSKAKSITKLKAITGVAKSIYRADKKKRMTWQEAMKKGAQAIKRKPKQGKLF